MLAHQQPGALDALVRRAVEVEAVVAREGTEFGVLERRVAVGGQQVRLQGLGGEYEEIFLPLFGAHQAQNAVTALAAVEAFLGAGAATGPIEQETVRAAFAAVRSPGRLERVRTSARPCWSTPRTTRPAWRRPSTRSRSPSTSPG